MSRRKEIIRVSIVFAVFFTSLFVGSPITVKAQTEPFFTLTAKTSGSNNYFDILNFVTQHLARIGIRVIPKFVEWGFFVNDLLFLHNWDLIYVGLVGGEIDPDWTGMYSQDAILNVFGYDVSMDWDDELGNGINEWYLKQGTLLMPPHSGERIQHYWDWEQYLMNELLPLQPTFTPELHTVTWSNLQGYDINEDLKTNWGKLSWNGKHYGQENTSRIIISENPWITVNPLFGFWQPTADIPNKVMDSLVSFDKDLNFYPHLADSLDFINETHLRMSLRENIKWQTDPEGLFPNEYFDADDVIFSFHAWKHVSDIRHTFFWLEDIKKIDQYTVDFFIDQDPTTSENEPYAPLFRGLIAEIVPEHYLNQTQLLDGKTPDPSHNSWTTFSTHCFGTSLFELSPLYNPIETNLLLFEDCWLLDPAVDKSNMDFERRFGNFSGGITDLKIRTMSDLTARFLEFELGNLDLIQFGGNFKKRDEYLENLETLVFEELNYFYGFLAYNMRESRGVLGSREPCQDDPSITKGLAVRKAISYAINRVEINQVIFGGEYSIQDYPIYQRMSKWCNPNIIRYNHDLEKAREYMVKAGYGEFTPDRLNKLEITGIVFSAALVTGIISSLVYWLNKIQVTKKKIP
ncbi:MAG: hypothetical protein FK732_04385 [Asgard group archaeon]|nr:hypothetical protein [Asgard group archaeon]